MPAADIRIIIGKKGVNINQLRSAYGGSDIPIPEHKEVKETYPLTINADMGVVQALILDITNLLSATEKVKNLSYLVPHLQKYELYAMVEYLESVGKIKRGRKEDGGSGGSSGTPAKRYTSSLIRDIFR